MRLLLDTHILLALVPTKLRELDPKLRSAVMSDDNASFVSAASLWEIAIKTRLGKLDPDLPLEHLLVIDHRHAVAMIDPEPATRDPFDRLLLSQCLVEDLLLVTHDRALSGHPLAWRAS
jgi:PIN domain nuclease of toxin-antitoxin system